MRRLALMAVAAVLACPAPASPAGQTEGESARWQTLRQGSHVRLSLADAIALALENNLDIELQRLGREVAETDLRRALAGSQGRGVPLAVREGPRSVALSGSLVSAATPLGVGSEANLSLAGGQVSTPGRLPPSFDAVLAASLRRGHQTLPQANAFAIGTSVLESDTTTATLSLVQGFRTGGELAVTFDATSQDLNNRRVDVNPFTQAGAGIAFTQPLLRGFGWSLNSRFIRISQRNREVADLVFQQQVVSTVSAVVRLYWDLSSLNAEVDVRRRNLARSEKLLSDTNAHVEVGTRATIDGVRAQAEVARARRDLLAIEGLARQQETILKDFLSRGTIADSGLAALSLELTDSPTGEAVDESRSLTDLVRAAVDTRPDLVQARLQIENARTAAEGSRNALLPTLDVVLSARTNALAGEVNPLVIAGAAAHVPDPRFVGDFRDALAQIGRRTFPDYGIAVQMNVPLRHRAASADAARDRVAIRQQELRLELLQKQVAVEIQNALTAVAQARAALDAASKEREFQERALAAEEDRLGVGVSTTYLVIQYQRDLAQAQSAEAAARAGFAIARAALDRASGRLLSRHGVIVEPGAARMQ
jgi:outer membrane protein TolC